MCQMRFDGALADIQLVRDFLVGLSIRKQFERCQLPRRELDATHAFRKFRRRSRSEIGLPGEHIADAAHEAFR